MLVSPRSRRMVIARYAGWPSCGAEPADRKIGRDACAVSCTDVVLAGGHPGAGLTAAGHCWR